MQTQIRLERDPDMVAAPIAAAFMFTPAIALMRAPAPVVVMHGNAERRTIIVALGGVPAIAIAVAADSGGRRRRHGSQGTGACKGAKDKGSDLHGSLHSEVKTASQKEERRNLDQVPPPIKDSRQIRNVRK